MRLLKDLPYKFTRWINREEKRKAKAREKRLSDQTKRLAWNLQRVALHTRIGGRCQRCKDRVYLSHRNPFVVLHSHHLIWKSRGGGDELSNQVGLDAKCHDLVHRNLVDVSGTAEDPIFTDIPQ